MEDSYFPTRIKEVDVSIILESSISDLISFYHTSSYFRDILDDPLTFQIFKEKYPYCIMNSFEEFLILNDELKKVDYPWLFFDKSTSKIGDRIIIENENYKISKSGLSGQAIKCDILGNIIVNDTKHFFLFN
jgi:hypothetical protein